MKKFSDAVLSSENGNPVPSATVTVKNLDNTAATIYSDDGVTQLPSNVVTAGQDGEYAFYAANGRYNLTIAAGSFTTETKTDVLLFDPDGVTAGSVKDATARVDTITALRALTAPTRRTVVVVDSLGVSANTYAWSSSSTASDDGYLVVRPNSNPASGRWILVVNGQVTPLQFGATAGGSVDARASVAAAISSGYVVNGLGLTYGISGNCQPTAITGLVNIKLKQLAPSTSSIRTLFIRALSNFVLRDVVVDAGSYYTGGSMTDCAGIWIDAIGGSSSDVRLENVTVTNMGPGNGVFVSTVNRLSMHNVWARECYHNVGASNDVLNGVWLDACTNVQVHGGGAVNVTGISTVRYSRGWVFTGCTNLTMGGTIVDAADQGFDFTGSAGNTAFSIGQAQAKNCGTFGFKWANSSHDGAIVGCIAEKCGLMGFTVSGMTEVGNPLVRNITFVNCHAYDTGSNNVWSASNRQGFRVAAGTYDTSYPRAIRFINCVADDRQGSATMTHGFANDVTAIEYNTAGYDKPDVNEVIGCTVRNSTGVPFSSMHLPVALAKGTGTTSATDSAWTAVNLDTDIEDTSALHNPASNNTNFYVKRPGRVRVTACVAFAANATGSRKARSLKNGGAGSYPDTVVVAHPTGVTYVYHTRTHTGCKAGDNIRVEGWQDSGGALNIDQALSWVCVEELG